MAGQRKGTLVTRTKRSTALALLGVACVGVSCAATIPATGAVSLPLEAITSRMGQVDEQKHANLPDFAVMRKYWLHNSSRQKYAEMVVRVT